MNKARLKEFALRAQAMIDDGLSEAKLRHHLSSRLLGIFPDDPWWVRAHMEGTEEYVRFSAEQQTRNGFVDALVGKTVIEYERNLTVQSVFAEGYHQVREYAAALCGMGIPETEALGVLSDTVRWYGYQARVVGEIPENGLLGPDNIELTETMFVDLSRDTDAEYDRFEQFIRQFMARDCSRLLNAGTLATDFGVDSGFYREHISVFSRTVQAAMKEKPAYANLIKQVWQNFIAYPGASDYGSFSMETYIREFYLVTLAKILCVNILAGQPVISSDEELKAILNGGYFLRQNIYNLVDYDYFGWLNEGRYADGMIPSVRELQARLRAYDFSFLGEQDIFGKLLAQLVTREHRLMLGQEFTPHWIARDIVAYNLESLKDEPPRFLDMCCGSGVFLIETVKAVRKKYGISAKRYDAEKDSVIFSCVMGFDIDPLAVMLAKVNWVMSMRDLFPLHGGSITAPIYHANSLSVATPITHRTTKDGEDYYVLTLNHDEIEIPAFLLSPLYEKAFDSFLSKAYRLAMARAETSENFHDAVAVAPLIRAVERESAANLESAQKRRLEKAAAQLITALESLQRQGLNGIWRFIISNSYRPGLTEGQFNRVISNPPWMAMSKLANNPYRHALREIAGRYSIQPRGMSHPHMELATIFLAASIDRYLKEGARFSCVMPASVMSGLNHEAFRREKYVKSEAGLSAKITAIWELPPGTFKNRAVALSGEKSGAVPPEIMGRVYESAEKFEGCTYTLNRQGNRSAWTNQGSDIDVADIIGDGSLEFVQGCDVFPRTALFHSFTRRANGNWDIKPIERTGKLWYLISDSKKNLCGNLTAENFDNAFVYDIYISKHLSPFMMAGTAKGIIPGGKVEGRWTRLFPADLALLNESSAYALRQISEAVGQDPPSFLKDTINIYGKLYRQNFSGADYLVLSSASGSNPCAAYVDLRNFDRDRLVIDQTLYWYLAGTEDEAVYMTGLLNSAALREAIADFQPEGGFGKRHIHTLPYKLISPFDPDDETHRKVVETTRALMEEWKRTCMQERYKRLLRPDSGTLNSRRRRQQEAIRNLDGYGEYDTACLEALI